MDDNRYKLMHLSAVTSFPFFFFCQKKKESLFAISTQEGGKKKHF